MFASSRRRIQRALCEPPMATTNFRARLRRGRLKFLFGDHSSFGCGWHRFRAAPRCSRAQLAAFESQWRVVLPAEFKTVLTEVGNGSGGPYYGLSPLESWCQPWDPSELDSAILTRPFLPHAPRERAVHDGAMRVCNAGCEHYLLLVVAGPHAGGLARRRRGWPSPIPCSGFQGEQRVVLLLDQRLDRRHHSRIERSILVFVRLQRACCCQDACFCC